MTKDQRMVAKKMTCSLGHENIQIVDRVHMMKFFGHEVPVPHKAYHCEECGETWVEGEIEHQNEVEIEKARNLTGVSSASLQLLSMRQFAAFLNISLKAAYKLVWSKRVATVRVGRLIRIKPQAVMDYLEDASRRAE